MDVVRVSEVTSSSEDPGPRSSPLTTILDSFVVAVVSTIEL